MYVHTYVYTCFNERKEERSKQGQTNNKARLCLLCLVVCLTLLASFFTSHPRQLIFPRKSDCLGCDVHVLMRDEKEGRKKQARLNKQQGKATQHTQGSHFS